LRAALDRLRERTRCAELSPFSSASLRCATPQRDANLFKIRIRDIAEYHDIDIVVDKRRVYRSKPIFASHSVICRRDDPAPSGGASAYQF
jgi:hypothetical protein